MTRIGLRLLFLLPAALLAQGQARPAPVRHSPASLAFTHVTVVDATGAAAKPGMTVVVTGDRIAALGRTGRIKLPSGARVVNAAGKFMIPGLWDMHTHWGRKDYLPLYLANGVTGVRFMKGTPAHRAWRTDIEAGALVGPRIVIASPLVDGPEPVFRDSITASNAAEGRQAVAKSIGGGADFIKVYSLLPRDAYFAIAGESRRRHIPFAGHVPRSITSAEASDAGQKSIEHLSGIAFACSSRDVGLPADLAKLKADVAGGANYLFSLRRLEGKHLDAYDAQKCAALFARFRRNATWQVPTLSVNQTGVRLGEPGRSDARRKYLPQEMRDTDPANHPVYKHFKAADFARLGRNLSKELAIVGAMQRAGVGLLTGTDVAPIGFSLHDELALLVRAGLTPMQALQTATRNPAIYLGQRVSLGTVEAGKLADLVLLDADPLADIGNTRKIGAVVVRGQYLDRATLDAMLARVETAANRGP